MAGSQVSSRHFLCNVNVSNGFLEGWTILSIYHLVSPCYQGKSSQAIYKTMAMRCGREHGRAAGTHQNKDAEFLEMLSFPANPLPRSGLDYILMLQQVSHNAMAALLCCSQYCAPWFPLLSMMVVPGFCVLENVKAI